MARSQYGCNDLVEQGGAFCLRWGFRNEFGDSSKRFLERGIAGLFAVMVQNKNSTRNSKLGSRHITSSKRFELSKSPAGCARPLPRDHDAGKAPPYCWNRMPES